MADFAHRRRGQSPRVAVPAKATATKASSAKSSLATADEKNLFAIAVGRYLEYLRVERNASALTIKSYREDLAALATYLAESRGAAPDPSQIAVLDLRGYSGWMHAKGLAKATIARRLASTRSFF